MSSSQLLDRPAYALRQKTKLIELTGEYDLLDPEGALIGRVVEQDVSATETTWRALLGMAGWQGRSLEVRDAAGTPVALVLTDGSEMTVVGTDGHTQAVLKVSTLGMLLPFPAAHPLFDAQGKRIGALRTHGLRRRRFSLELGGVVLATARQPWNGVLREWKTQADRYEYSSQAEAPEHVRAVPFVLPLLADLAFKGLGSPSPLGGIVSVLP